MSRTIGIESLEQKIKKAQEQVIRAKAVYDEKVDELQELLDKRSALRQQEIIKAIANSSKSYEEIMRFITEPEEE